MVVESWIEADLATIVPSQTLFRLPGMRIDPGMLHVLGLEGAHGNVFIGQEKEALHQ